MSPFFLAPAERSFPPERVMRLDDEALRAAMLEAADDNNLVVDDI